MIKIYMRLTFVTQFSKLFSNNYKKTNLQENVKKQRKKKVSAK